MNNRPAGGCSSETLSWTRTARYPNKQVAHTARIRRDQTEHRCTSLICFMLSFYDDVLTAEVIWRQMSWDGGDWTATPGTQSCAVRVTVPSTANDALSETEGTNTTPQEGNSARIQTDCFPNASIQ
jgi:hypothetical protein